VKVARRLRNLGEGVLELQCSRQDELSVCEKKFFFNDGDEFNHGFAICPSCGNRVSKEDIEGIYFMEIETDSLGHTNWECGKCGCQFPKYGGDTEATVVCPACKHKKELV